MRKIYKTLILMALLSTSFTMCVNANDINAANNKADSDISIKNGEKVLNIELKEAVETALKNNYDIQLSKTGLEKAEATVEEARSSKRPTVKYSWQAGRAKVTVPSAEQIQLLKGINKELNKKLSFTIPISSKTVVGTRYTQNLNVIWPVWTGGAAENAIDAAKYAESVSKTDIYQKEADVKLSATEAYFGYLKTLNMVEVTNKAVQNLSEHVNNVKLQYDAGIVAKLDVLSSEVSLANAKEMNIAAKNYKDVAEANLNNVMNTPIDTKLSPKSKDFPEPEIKITMDEAIKSAEKYRWELIKAKYAIEIAKAQVGMNKAGNKPVAAVGGGFDWTGSALSGFDKDNWKVFGTVNWNLWDGGASAAKVKKAQASVKEAEQIFKQAQNKIKLEIKKDYLDVFAAKAKIQTARATVEQAEQAYKISVIRYRSGVGTNLDVLDGQLALSKAKTNYINAMYDYNIGLAKLERAMGIPAVLHKEFSK